MHIENKQFRENHTIFEKLLISYDGKEVKFATDKVISKPLRRGGRIFISYSSHVSYIKIQRFEENKFCNYLTISLAKIQLLLTQASNSNQNLIWEQLEQEVINILVHSYNHSFHMKAVGLFKAI